MSADRLALDDHRSSPDVYSSVITIRRKGAEDVGALKKKNKQTIAD